MDSPAKQDDTTVTETVVSRLSQDKVLSREQQFIVFDLYALVVEQDDFQTCLSSLVNEIASNLSCNRVSLGLLDGQHIQLQAISHSYEFQKEASLIHDIVAAMDETISQDSLVVYPIPDEQQGKTIVHHHRTLSQRQGSPFICSIPLVYNNQLTGVLILERPEKFAASTLRLIELLAMMITPVIELKQQVQSSLAKKNLQALKQQVKKLTGPRHALAKVIVSLSALMLIFFSLFSIDYHVSTDASLEGRVQRVVASPVDGFLSTAEVRAGDVVEKGQLMARLEDKDLKLEHARLANQRQQHNKEYRQALALHERAKATILNAKIKQTDAQIELIDKQLARLQIIAPFNGVVIEGDLDQLLGTPVERGQKLYVTAPLDDYRIILNIDEREISFIKTGQAGQLVLSSMPNKVLPINILSITPVSTSKDNRNYFRVEAKLNKPNRDLHPGMKGIARINTGEQKLLWIWTHHMTDWLRLVTWSMLP